MLENYLDIHPEIKKALRSIEPIVTIDSSIISNKSIYPENIKLIKSVSKIIRDNGAVPATIAIINGKLKVGLIDDEIELLAKDKNIIKCNINDLPFIISTNLNALTTISSAAIISSLAGIKVLISDQLFNISLDILDISNTSVICCGIKSSFVDLKYSGTSSIDYDCNKFYIINDSKTNYTINSIKELANLLKVKWDLNLKGAVVIKNSKIDNNLTQNSIIATNLAKELCTLYK